MSDVLAVLLIEAGIGVVILGIAARGGGFLAGDYRVRWGEPPPEFDMPDVKWGFALVRGEDLLFSIEMWR